MQTGLAKAVCNASLANETEPYYENVDVKDATNIPYSLNMCIDIYLLIHLPRSGFHVMRSCLQRSISLIDGRRQVHQPGSFHPLQSMLKGPSRATV